MSTIFDRHPWVKYFWKGKKLLAYTDKPWHAGEQCGFSLTLKCHAHLEIQNHLIFQAFLHYFFLRLYAFASWQYLDYVAVYSWFSTEHNYQGITLLEKSIVKKGG